MFKSILTQLAVAMAMSASAMGSAHAFSVIAGDFKMHLDFYDSATTGYTGNCSSVALCDETPSAKALGSVGSVNPSADTMGIFSVSSITKISTNSAWFSRGTDGYLTGIFGNLMDAEVSLNVPSSTGLRTEIKSVGGTFRLFKNEADYDTSSSPMVAIGTDLNNNLYSSISNGVVVLDGKFVPGVVQGDTTTTFKTSFNNSTFSGESSGFLNVTGGEWQHRFGKNTIALPDGVGKADLFASFAFWPDIDAFDKGFAVVGEALIMGHAVPEPGSLALVALGLLGMGAATRRQASPGRKPART